MPQTISLVRVGAALALFLLVGGQAVAATRESVAIDGSSTVFPLTEAVAEEFQEENYHTTRLTVGVSGTGGGFKKFCRGEIDISDASRPILAQEMEACRKNGIHYYELPVAFDALTVVVNPKNDWVQSITLAELKAIWEPAAQQKIMRWNQIRKEWPDQPITLYGAGSDSGTFDYFTDAVTGKAKASRGDYTASEDDNVLVQGISKDVHALGYLPYAYYEPNRAHLRALGVDRGTGPVLPSPESVTSGRYAPFARPLFIYVNAASAQRPEVRKFVDFYLTHGPKLVTEVKCLPLSDAAYQAVSRRFAEGETGTGFGGVPEVGLPVEALLKRKPVH